MKKYLTLEICNADSVDPVQNSGSVNVKAFIGDVGYVCTLIIPISDGLEKNLWERRIKPLLKDEVK